MTRYFNAARLPLCAEPEWLSASRPRLFGAAELRFRAPERRPFPAAHRGYRPGALPAGIRGRDPSGSRLARNNMGNAGAAAVGTPRGLSRGAAEADGLGPDLSCLRKPGRNRQTGGAARGAGAVAARPRRRAALSGYGEVAVAGRAGAPARFGRALCAAARHGGGLRAGRHPGLDRARRRSRWRDRCGGRPAGRLGRRHPRAQGDADQLSPLGGGRRRLAGRHRGGARHRPVLVDQRAPAAAAAARPAAAGLAAPPPRARRRRAEAVEIDQRPPVFANSGRGGRLRPTSAVWSACLDRPARPRGTGSVRKRPS